jgi:uncharacterized membrane protein
MLEHDRIRMSEVEVLPEGSTGVVSTLVLVVGLAALFLGYGWFWVVFAVGYAGVVPLVAKLSKGDVSEDVAGLWTDDEKNPEDAAETDPLETLRERYARGELSEAQFERKLEQLLETETIEDVEDAGTERAEPTAAGDLDTEERGRERER